MGKAFAKWYDTFMSPLERGKFTYIRKNLLKKAKGQVLEIGSGTGINFPFYEFASGITAIEPSQHMIEKSVSKLESLKIPIKIIHTGAESLPFEDNSFDTIVGTLVFCTIENPVKAIEEMKRVCKPNGEILLFEHVKMENPLAGQLQEWLTPFWRKICDGCCLNRTTLKLLEDSGLQITEIEKLYKGFIIVIVARNVM